MASSAEGSFNCAKKSFAGVGAFAGGAPPCGGEGGMYDEMRNPKLNIEEQNKKIMCEAWSGQGRKRAVYRA